MQTSIEDEEGSGCECCDSRAEHEAWLAKENAYWSAYFGGAVRNAAESERAAKDAGIKNPSSPEGMYEIQWRLK